MAKNLRKIISMIIALALCFGMIATPAMAAGKDNQSSTETEWYQVIVNGKTVASASGEAGDHTWLVQGVYSWDVSVSGTTMRWRAGNHSGTVNLENYITIPDGYEIAEGGYTVEHKSVEGTNSQSANFDNAIITVTISALYNPTTGETVPVTPPTEPSDPTDPSDPCKPTDPSEPSEPPKPVETKVTVNHKYYTYDVYTGETTLDGSTSASEDATEGDSYTATAVPTYDGNTYTQQTDDAALTITVQADPEKNVINIEYLRTIDTTPEDYIPVLEIVKTAGKEFYNEGETITWTITVMNISDFTAYNVAVVDELTGDSWTIEALAPGAQQSFTATMENAEPGIIENVAVVTWEDGDDIPEDDDDNYDEDDEITEVLEDLVPVLEIIKTADKEAYKAGETITWTITVKNISEYTAYNVAVVDELTDDSWTIEALEPGAEQSFTATMENAEVGLVENVAVVTWEDGDDIPEDDNDNTDEDDEIIQVEENIPEDPAPVLRIVKTSSKYLFAPGETVTWYISVENISDYTAYNVVVTDELTGDTWRIGTLEPGAGRTLTATTENLGLGAMTNIAVVTWTDGDDIPDAQEADEIKWGSDDASIIIQEPVPEEEEHPIIPFNDIGEDIFDEEVPLAAAPKTGDISGILATISMISLGGMILLNRKKEEE